MGVDRVTCGKCHRKCAGQVLAVGETYFHHYCFTCQECGSELGEDAFYNKDGAFYCSKDYLDNFGERCFKCHQFLEGEVISALGNTFHLDCFSCGHCKKFFPPGETVIFDGRDYLCEDCDAGVDPSSHLPLHRCAGCHKEIETGQALMALDQHWHPQCFTCRKCGIVLHGEYMGKDGYAFCEKDYQSEFGVVCASCQGYITGKVLQAGDKHYHPQCSRCAKCGQMFGEGEEMYLQGSEIWHPQCSEMVREMEREKERAEAERRETERLDMLEKEEQKREMERREAERREAERRENERREAERREAERREGERREVERRENERMEAERRERERREREIREQIEAERREAERREMEQREIERKDMERREAEKREMDHREAERREAEQREMDRKNQRGYYQGRVGGQVDVNLDGPVINHTDHLPPPNFSPPPGHVSPEYDDLPPPPRPEEMPKGPPAPPTRTASRATDWKARYGSLPRNTSGSGNSDTSNVQTRDAPARPRPYSYHEPSYNSYEGVDQNTTVSQTTDQKYKTSVQLKIGRSTDDSKIGTSTRTTSSSSSPKSPSTEHKVIPYKDLRVDNYRMPRGVDKSCLEKYLSDEEFREVFRMSKDEFYALPKWKQHDQKKKVKLF